MKMFFHPAFLHNNRFFFKCSFYFIQAVLSVARVYETWQCEIKTKLLKLNKKNDLR